jgi:hypothetical protein
MRHSTLRKLTHHTPPVQTPIAYILRHIACLRVAPPLCITLNLVPPLTLLHQNLASPLPFLNHTLVRRCAAVDPIVPQSLHQNTLYFLQLSAQNPIISLTPLRNDQIAGLELFPDPLPIIARCLGGLLA